MKKVWERRSHAFPPHYTPAYNCEMNQRSPLCERHYAQPASRMQPNLGFSCGESILHTDNQSLF